MKAAIYCRFSTDKQREASIADQERVCREYAQREGWTVARVFSDKGMSGGDAERPGYKDMLRAARNNQFQLILCEDVSRLWRDPVEQPRCVAELQFHETHVIGINDGIDTRREGFEYLLAIKGVQNAGYRKETGKRTHRGQRGQVLKGYNAGGRAFGYRHIPVESPTEKDEYGRPLVIGVRREPDPAQKKIVAEIFIRYGQGWAPRAIADDLNRRQVPSPGASWNRKVRRRDGKWLGSTIVAMLGNPLYAGKQVWNRSRWKDIPKGTKKPNGEEYRGRKQRRERPESEWVVIENETLKIIDQRTWDAVQARRNARASMKNNQHPDIRPRQKYLFSGLLKCAECGQNFTITGPNQYGCGSRTNGGKHACNNGIHVSRRIVEDRLLEGIKRDLFTPEAIAKLRQRIVELQAERRNAKKPDQEAARRELAAVEKKIEGYIAAIEAGTFSPTLKAKLEAAEQDRARLQATIKADTRQADKVVQLIPDLLDRYQRLVGDLAEVSQRDVARARAQIKTLLGGAVRLHPTEQGYLEAELAGDYAGLLRLASSGSANLNLHGSGGRI